MAKADLRALLQAQVDGAPPKARGNVITPQEFDAAHDFARACATLRKGGAEAVPAPAELLPPLP